MLLDKQAGTEGVTVNKIQLLRFLNNVRGELQYSNRFDNSPCAANLWHIT